MNNALIGYTGFVGQNLNSQGEFNHLYNSKNIEEIRGKSFDTVFCAGISAVKWKANKEPETDLKAVNNLLVNLKYVKAEKFIHISTVDVYPDPVAVDESTEINTEILHPYGKHRLMAENFIKENFENHFIIRLPGLFGNGLKKNIIFDLMNNNCLDMINAESVFQFYSLDNIYRDIIKVTQSGIRLFNFATEPVSVDEVANKVFNSNFKGNPDKPKAVYDMQTQHADIFGREKYIYNKAEVLSDIKSFVERSKVVL